MAWSKWRCTLHLFPILVMSTTFPKTVKGIANLHQLELMLIAFIFTGILFNAIGVKNWANRIPVEQNAKLRNTVINLSQSWEALVDPLGLNQPREWVDHLKEKMLSATEKSIAPSPQQLSSAPPPKDNIPSLPSVIVEESSISSIALVGDSMMAVSVAPNLNRELKKIGIPKVIQAYRSGTGLSRPDYFNWMVEYPKFLAGQSPQIVVCAIGANDAQGFQVGNRVYQFGTPEWNEEYGKRLENFLNLIQANNAYVYWLVLPRMRSPGFDGRIQALNQVVQNKLGHRRRFQFIRANEMVTPNSPNEYAEYTKDLKQNLEKIRGDDGIHFSDAGGRKLALGIASYLINDGVVGQSVSK